MAASYRRTRRSRQHCTATCRAQARLLLESARLMRREFLKRFTPDPQTACRHRWYLRLFGRTRRASGLVVTAAPRGHRRLRRGACHLLHAAAGAPAARRTVRDRLAAQSSGRSSPPSFCVNPLTAVPIYYAAYRVGAALLHVPRQRFHFVPELALVCSTSLAPCGSHSCSAASCARIVIGFTGWLVLELVWRQQVRSRYRTRHQLRAASAADAARAHQTAALELKDRSMRLASRRSWVTTTGSCRARG